MIDTYIDSILCGDVLEQMALLPDESVNLICTSPPYWCLRDYGYKEQWGLEPTFAAYLDHLAQFMAEAKRVLRPDGCVFINIGDTYGGTKSGNTDVKKHKENPGSKIVKNDGSNKCLLLLPHRFALNCIDSGWLLRNTIIWQKKNAMPESVTDRFSKKHENIFFFVKSEKYYFDLDAIRQPLKTNVISRNKASETYGRDSGSKQFSEGFRQWGDIEKGKNPGDCSDLWDITTKPSTKRHYAMFNPELIRKPVLAGCPEGGIVLDPFCGTGTTLAFAKKSGRHFIGIDGSEKYCRIAEKAVSHGRQLDLF